VFVVLVVVVVWSSRELVEMASLQCSKVEVRPDLGLGLARVCAPIRR